MKVSQAIKYLSEYNPDDFGAIVDFLSSDEDEGDEEVA